MGSCPEKLCSNLGGFDKEFYSNGSKVTDKIRVCAGPALL